jgi:hypothetical protein
VQLHPQRDRGLEKAGVKLRRDDEVVGITHKDLAVASGARHPAGLVVNASFKLPTVAITGHSLHWPFEIEDDLSLKAYQNIWVTAMKKQGQERRFLTTADLVALGKAVGYNAWASSQGYATRPFQPRKPARTLQYGPPLTMPHRWVHFRVSSGLDNLTADQSAGPAGAGAELAHPDGLAVGYSVS